VKTEVQTSTGAFSNNQINAIWRCGIGDLVMRTWQLSKVDFGKIRDRHGNSLVLTLVQLQ
jgi:hypothetical protein